MRQTFPVGADWDTPDALEAVLRDSEDDDLVGSNKPGKWMRPAKCLELGRAARDFGTEEAENVISDMVGTLMHVMGLCAAEDCV
jgi:hypothetical protein